METGAAEFELHENMFDLMVGGLAPDLDPNG